MKDLFLEIVKLFTAFFLGSIAANFVEKKIGDKLLLDNEKKVHDKKLAKELLQLFKTKDLENFSVQIQQGFLTSEYHHGMLRLLDIKDYGKFYCRRTQKRFIEYLNAFNKFVSFYSTNFSYDSKTNRFWIHKYQHLLETTPEQNKEIENRYAEAKISIEKVLEKFSLIDAMFRKRFPDLYTNIMEV